MYKLTDIIILSWANSNHLVVLYREALVKSNGYKVVLVFHIIAAKSSS